MLHRNKPTLSFAVPHTHPIATDIAASAPPHQETTRGAQARERMLRAALTQFGRHGFDGTTTRMIAAAAEMNLGAIPYYFGTKEELYVEAAGFLSEALEARQREPLQRLLAAWDRAPVHPSPDDRAALIELVVDFLCQQARILLRADFPAEWVQFFLRVQAEEGPAFDRLFHRVLAPMQDAVEGLIARICGRDASDMRPRALTFLAAHQVMSFRLSDAVLMRRLGWHDLSPDRIDQLLELIATTLRAQLAALAAPPAPAP